MTPEQLKTSILLNAIQGKLVEQIDTESCCDIRSTYQGEASDLFDIPVNWKWVAIKDVVTINTGLSFKKQAQKTSVDGTLRILRGGNIGDDYKYHLYDNDIYVDLSQFKEKYIPLQIGDVITPSVTSMEKMCKTGFIDVELENTTAGGFVYIIRSNNPSILDSKYLLYFISSSFNKEQCKPNIHKSGQAFYNLKKSGFVEQPICLPPIKEQHRIVAKIEELLPYVDRYAEAYEKLEQFNAKFPEDMKKSILQYAIQGKLVEQRPEEGTAEELYQKIQEEKKRLIKEGRIKKEKSLAEITEDEIPFEIPESWKWVKLGMVVSLLSGSDFPPSKYNNQANGIPYMTGASNIEDNHLIINRWTETPNNISEQGDLLLVCKGSGYGKTVMNDIGTVHIARQFMAFQRGMSLDYDYLNYFLQSQLGNIKQNGQGVIPGIDRAFVLSILFPLPPLEEQRRIVAKIEELLPYCEELIK